MSTSRFKIQHLKHALSKAEVFNISKGFSLVELLVVVAILGILSVMAYLGIQSSQVRTMNEKVESDLLAIQNALEQFKEDNGHYPALNELTLGGDKNVLCFDDKMAYLHICEKSTFIQTQIDNNLLTKRYLQEVPTDPRTQSRYSYGATTDGKYYQIAGIQAQKNNAWTAKVLGNLDDGSNLPGLLRAYDAGNFVSEGGNFLPYSPNPKKITARLNGIKGTVMVNGGPAIEGQVVQPGDTIKTSAESTVILYFSDGSITYLDENSQLRLLPTSEVSENSKENIITKIRLKLFQGNAWNKVVRLADQSEFNIETTTAIAGVRGTEFGISAEKDELVVYSGTVASRLKTADEKTNSNGEGQYFIFSVDDAFNAKQDAQSDGSEMKRFTIPAQDKAVGAGVTLGQNEMNEILNKYYPTQSQPLSEVDRPYIVQADAHVDGTYTLFVTFNGLNSVSGVEATGFDLYGESQASGIRTLKDDAKPLLSVPATLDQKANAYRLEVPYQTNGKLYNTDKNQMESIVLKAYLETKTDPVYSSLSWPAIGLQPDPKEEYTYRFDNAETYKEFEKSPELEGKLQILPLDQTIYALNEGPIELKATKACDWTIGGGNNSGIFKEGGKNTALAQYYPLDPDMTAAEKMANVMGRFGNNGEEKVDIKCTNPEDPNDADSTSLTITYAPKTMSGESGYWYSYTAQAGTSWQNAHDTCAALKEGGKTWSLPSMLVYQNLDIAKEKTNLCEWDENNKKCGEGVLFFAMAEADPDNPKNGEFLSVVANKFLSDLKQSFDPTYGLKCITIN